MVDDLVEDIKFVIVKTLESVKRKLDPNKRKGTFDILGYDFMVDYDMTVWLIECNTNPCLDESSSILKRLLPRMLDDAFKLSIDRDFPNPLCQYYSQLENFLKSRKEQEKQPKEKALNKIVNNKESILDAGATISGTPNMKSKSPMKNS